MPFTHLTEALPVKQQVFDGSSVSVVLLTKSPVSLVLVSLWWIGCCQLPERRAMPTEGLQPDRAGGQRQPCQGLRAEERGGRRRLGQEAMLRIKLLTTLF